MDPSDTVIEVRDLIAGYGDRVVLENVNFQVKRGEVFVILGGSGCGKSTLLKHIIGLQPPLGGTVRINSEDIVSADEDRRRQIQQGIGVLFQSGALFASLTVGENVALPLEEYTPLSPEMISLAVGIKLNMVKLGGFEGFFPTEISGGMKKRAGLARAMALDPSILFFDEPSAGLDPVTSAELDELILQINRSLGTTVVVVTHELASIFAIASRVIMLDAEAKAIIAEGTPQDLRDHSPNPRVRDFFNRKPAAAGGRMNRGDRNP